MKKFMGFTAVLLSLSILFGSVGAAAADFDALDAGTALAGSSYALQNFIETNNDASNQIAEALFTLGKISGEDAFSIALSDTDSSVNGEEIEYLIPREGVADVDAFLNVRVSPSTMTDIIEGIIRGGSVSVIGEWMIHGETWYKVLVNDREGYVFGDFLLFDEEAEAFKAQVLEEAKAAAILPEKFEIPEEDLSNASDELKEQLTTLATGITYVLSVSYPEAEESESYLDNYSVLIFLLENYEQVIAVAEENGLAATKYAAEQDVNNIELNRLKLSDLTGRTDEEMQEELMTETIRRQEEAAEAARKAEEARRAAEAAAEAERAAKEAAYQQQVQAAQAAAQAAQAAQQKDIQDAMNAATGANSSTGGQIAAFAAQWVGRIPYVWGGNAFYEGGGVDCSHFTYNVLKQFGLCSYYENSYGQRNWGRPVDISQIQPGDLVCYEGHVAIYYGDGKIVHAPAPGRYIEYGSLYVKPVVGVRRLY